MLRSGHGRRWPRWSRPSLVTAIAFALACEAATTAVEPEPEPDPVPPLIPAVIRASVDSLTFDWLGATSRVDAEVRDSAGIVITDRPPLWNTADSAVATVDPGGSIRATGAGSTLVVATLDELADTVHVSVVQRPVAIVITPDSLTLAALGDTALLAARAHDRGGAPVPGVEVVWSVADSTILAIQEAGSVRALANGTTLVRATAGELSDETPVTVRQTVDAIRASPDVLVFSRTGEAKQLTAGLFDRNGSPVPDMPVSWASEDSTVAKVDGQGLVTSVDAGGTRILIAAGAVSASVPVSVMQAPARIEVQPSEARLTFVGDEVQLVATVYDDGGRWIPHAEVEWSSSSNSAVVNSAGRVTMAGQGAATVTAAVAGVSGAATVSLDQVVTGLTSSPDEATIHRIGARIKLVAALVDRGGAVVAPASSAITWTSRDPAVATVTTDGDVTTSGIGETWVVASGEGYADSTRVIATDDAFRIRGDASIPWGQELGFRAAFTHLNGQVEEYRPQVVSRDPFVVEVLGPGRIRGAGVGETWIHASREGYADSFKVDVHSGPTRLTPVPLGRELELFETVVLQLRASSDFHELEVQGEWEARDSTIASISGWTDGLARVNSVRPGTTWLVARAYDLVDSVEVTVGHRWRGDLAVTNQSELTALRELQVSEVTGHLTVVGTALTTLDGLESIETVARDVTIASNPNLADLDGLAFESIGGSLTVEANPAVRSAGSLGGLLSLGGSLRLAGNTSLVVPVFPRLEWLVDLVVHGNAGVQDPALFPALRRSGGNFVLSQSASQLTFPVLESFGWLTVGSPGPLELRFPEVRSMFGLTLSPEIQSLYAPVAAVREIQLSGSGLRALDLPASAPSVVSIRGNPHLVSVHLPAVTDATVAVADNPSLETLSLPGLRSGTLELARSGLTRLDWGHADMVRAGISEMPNLTSVTLGSSGMGGLKKFGFFGNPVLTSISFPHSSGMGHLDITSNASLVSFSAPAAGAIGIIKLVDSPALTTMHTPLLEDVSTELLVDRTALTNLDWLSSVAGNVSKWVRIVGNGALADVSGLSRLGSSGGGSWVTRLIEFTGNTALPESAIRNLLETIDDRRLGDAFDEVVVSGNAPGAPARD